jgi:hypothetical protein
MESITVWDAVEPTRVTARLRMSRGARRRASTATADGRRDAYAVTPRLGWHPILVWPWSVLSFTIVLVAMEPYSAWVHRVVWHGPLWSLHRSHHRERIGAHTSGGLVANDALSANRADAKKP